MTVDTTAPTADVVDVAPEPGAAAVGAVMITFSEPVAGLTTAALSLTRDGGGANLLTGAQTVTTTENVTWTVNNLSGLTAAAGTYTLTLAPSAGLTDVAGNALAAEAGDTWATDLAPTVSQVFVRGASRTEAYLNALAAAGQGDGTYGFAVAGGAEQHDELT